MRGSRVKALICGGFQMGGFCLVVDAPNVVCTTKNAVDHKLSVCIASPNSCTIGSFLPMVQEGTGSSVRCWKYLVYHSDERISQNWSEQISDYTRMPKNTKRITEYIWMPKNWPNEYSNIFRCQRTDQTNKQIYSDAQELTKLDGVGPVDNRPSTD